MVNITMPNTTVPIASGPQFTGGWMPGDADADADGSQGKISCCCCCCLGRGGLSPELAVWRGSEGRKEGMIA